MNRSCAVCGWFPRLPGLRGRSGWLGLAAAIFATALWLGNAGAVPALALDKLTLRDGKTVEGEILDITDKLVVILAGKDRRVIPRAQLGTIERAAQESLRQLFERQFQKLTGSKKLEDLKALALFCQKEKLHPERRQTLREMLKIDPENAEARSELGHASLDSKWLEEEEVAAKLKEGFESVDGKLVRKTGVTVVQKQDPLNAKYRFLDRKKLSASERKKMEKEREDRLKSADKFLAMKEKEYEGIPWEKRHIIKKQHFEIHCNSTRKVAEAYGAMMEIIRGKLAEMFQSEIKRSFSRAQIHIYASQEDFLTLDPEGKRRGRGIGGYYRPATQAIHAFHGTFGFTGTTFGVLCHEGTHYLQGLVLQDFENVPMWLIEGLAVYFGDGSTFDPKTAKIGAVGQIPRDRLAHIQEKMLVKRHEPLKRLVTMTLQDGFNGSHYADAWALIYYLVNSGKKGEKLLQEYWGTGLKRRLTKKDFTDLAEKYFEGLEPLEKQYVDYILNLAMPPSGRVVGDYFVSDTFQFDYKAPGEDWQFFEDKDDKKMLVGLLPAGGSGEIRIYYRNNELWQSADDYLESYLKVTPHWKDVKKEEVKSGKLEWKKLAYIDDGSGPTTVRVRQAQGGSVTVEVKKPEPTVRGARDVVRFLLVQIDGVVEIECSAKQGEGPQYAQIFDDAYKSFTLSFARRW